MLDLLGDIITLPFELIGGSFECLCGCLAIASIAACLLAVVLVVVVL